MPATAYRLSVPREQVVSRGPFRGARDSLDPTTADPGLAFELRNCYPQDAQIGGGTVGRPGFQQAGLIGGGVGARKGQRSYQFTKRDGTEYTVRIVGGKFYTFNWSTRVWTEAISAATLSGAAITLSATTAVWLTTFADKLIVSDGVNTPWYTSDCATVVKLTAWPVVYGPMTVYYGKLFGIKNAARQTFVWCEEGDPTIGCEAGGYNNAWDFVQVDGSPLTRLVGTNEALYVFRARSLEYVLGEVSDNFSTTGTKAGVSQTIGTTAPGAVVVHEHSIFFLDADARPQRLEIGGALQEPAPWLDCRETIRLFPKAVLTAATGCDYPPANLILLGVCGLNATVPERVLTFNATTGQFAGIWDGFGSFETLDLVKNGSGDPTLLHMGTDGYTYDWGSPSGSLWTDGLNAGTQVIEHTVSWWAAYDEMYSKQFLRLDVWLRLPTNLTGLRADYTTPNSVDSSTRQTAGTLTGNFSLYGVAQYGTDLYGGTSQDRHYAFGLSVEARGIRPRLQHNGSGEQLVFLRGAITALPVGPIPQLR
jgi:hypothetical protein